MSLLDRAEELKDVSDAQLAQIVQQGSEAGDTWLAATETQRRKDMRDRYNAQLAKQQAEQAGQIPPKPITEARVEEMMGASGGIPSVDPNMDVPPDPSLQTGIAGPPPGMAGGGGIPRFQTGAGVGPGWFERQKKAWDAARLQDPYYAGVEWPEYLQQQEAYKAAETARLETEPRRMYEEEYLPSVGPYGEEVIGGRRPALDYEAWLAENPQARALSGFELLGKVAGSGRFKDIGEEEFEHLRGRPVGRQGQVMTLRDATALWKSQQKVADDATQVDVDDATQAGVDDVTQVDVDDVTEADSPDLIAADIAEKIAGGRGATIRNASGGSGRGGLSSGAVGDVYDDALEAIGSYRGEMGESPADRDWDKARRSAADKALRQAEGIRSLDQERLRTSDDRLAELMREMRTPEQARASREGAALGGLSKMFLDPNLRTGIAGLSDDLKTTDADLRADRKAALTEIYGQREEGMDIERTSQKEYDTADIAVDNLESSLAEAQAKRGRAGAEQEMLSTIELLKSKAQGINAWNNTMAQITSAMEQATLNRDNPLAQAAAWESMENFLSDWAKRLDPIKRDASGNPVQEHELADGSVIFIPDTDARWDKRIDPAVSAAKQMHDLTVKSKDWGVAQFIIGGGRDILGGRGDGRELAVTKRIDKVPVR